MSAMQRGFLKIKKHDANVFRFALRMLCVLPITTLFQNYAILNNINKVLIFLILICLFLSFFRMKFRPIYWLSLLAIIGLTGYDYLISAGVYATLNDPIYLLFWFLLMMICTEASYEITSFARSHLNMIQWVIGIWIFLVGISIFLPSSYVTEWGGESYFGSFPRSVFRLAPSACLIQTFLLIALGLDREHKQLYLLCQLVPLYCGFMGGSRTYFAVIALYFLLFLRYYAASKSLFYFYLITVLLLGVIAFGFSGIGAKVASTQYTTTSYFDFWGTLTNGRSEIWSTDLQYYVNADIISILFGSGYDKVYELSLSSRLGAAVYAHNDFINILIVNGAAGIIFYVLPVLALLRHFRKRVNASISVLTGFVAIWIGNAFFNMNYTYTCAAIALSFLPIALGFASSTHPETKRDGVEAFPLVRDSIRFR